MATKKAASGGTVTITTSPGTKLTPAAHQKLKDLTDELQKTGAVVDTNPATCENYVTCKKLRKDISPEAASGKKPLGPAKPIVKRPVTKPLE